MRAIINSAIQQKWNISSGTVLSTPSARSTFTVQESAVQAMHISTEGGTPMTIRRDAIEATLHYLVEHAHSSNNPCEIRSNKIYADAGPLCRVARDANQPGGSTMVITYVLPILRAMELVEMDEKMPNTVWVI